MDIVLIPGALATPKFWHNQEKYLHDKHNIHHVVNFSGKSITEIAETIIQNLPDKFALIGFSLGGYIAIELIKLIPDRISKLVLINSGARPISTRGQLERERSIELINNGKFDFLIKLIFKNSIFDKDKRHELLPFLKEMAVKIGPKLYLEQLTAIVNKPDHSKVLTKIQCPTLLLASKNDLVMPNERSEHMAKYISNSQLIYLDNCGHMAPLEQPDNVNRIISDWL